VIGARTSSARFARWAVVGAAFTLFVVLPLLGLLLLWLWGAVGSE
jgi:hypothetical protein